MSRLLFLLSLFLLLLGGCGYHTLHGSVSSHDTSTVQVAIFANRTFRPSIEAALADAVTDELGRRPGWQVGGSGSEYVLSGTVLTYTLTPASYTRFDQVREFRAAVTAEVTLSRSADGKVVKKRLLSWEEVFPADPSSAVQQSNEDAAVKMICRHLAEQVFVSLAGDF